MNYTSKSHYDIPTLILAVSKCPVDRSLYRDTCCHILCSIRPDLLLLLFRPARLYGLNDGFDGVTPLVILQILRIRFRTHSHAAFFTTSLVKDDNRSIADTLPNFFSGKFAKLPVAFVLVFLRFSCRNKSGRRGICIQSQVSSTCRPCIRL